MKQIPILAGSQIELDCYLRANPWINKQAVIRVTQPYDLHGHGGMVLALPAWQASPSIANPRGILEFIAAHGMQLVALEQAAFAFDTLRGGLDVATDRIEIPVKNWDKESASIDKAISDHNDKAGRPQ